MSYIPVSHCILSLLTFNWQTVDVIELKQYLCRTQQTKEISPNVQRAYIPVALASRDILINRYYGLCVRKN